METSSRLIFVEYIIPISISTLALAVSAITFFSQRAHNRNSVRPIFYIDIGDYLSHVYVNIVNVGIGPGTIVSMNVQSNGIDIKAAPYSSLSRVYPVIDKKHKKWKMCWGGM